MCVFNWRVSISKYLLAHLSKDAVEIVHSFCSIESLKSLLSSKDIKNKPRSRQMRNGRVITSVFVYTFVFFKFTQICAYGLEEEWMCTVFVIHSLHGLHESLFWLDVPLFPLGFSSEKYRARWAWKRSRDSSSLDELWRITSIRSCICICTDIFFGAKRATGCLRSPRNLVPSSLVSFQQDTRSLFSNVVAFSASFLLLPLFLPVSLAPSLA